ncbi:MAG: ABC transporter ATP-binding protein, partial [Angustibacter sp.]
ILILDEPTVGLDPQQRGQFREIIAELGESHLVLLSTHQTEDVSAVCSRVIVMAKGAMLFDGEPNELAELAQGRVWLSTTKHPAAIAGWRTGNRQYRNIGNAPPDAELAHTTLDDGYLVLLAEAGEKIEVPA